MQRILFVDDEPHVLGGLRAMLRRQRAQWEMVFVESGPQALEELARIPYDVIVTDMRMPGMDGAALLALVQERHPAVVRIVLSGYAEMEAALRTVPLAHQFLAKPCDAGELENVVGRACALQALIHDGAVREIVGKVRSLPPSPRIYFELTGVLANDEAGVSEVARVVERDPTLVAKVLQLVNSAFLGLGRKVSSIHESVSYLGTSMLRDLTLVAHVFGPQGDAEREVMDAVQEHSLLVGMLARQLAGTDRRTGDDAFIAGVLHDIGKVILGAEDSKVFAARVRRARAEGKPLFALEREELGVTHAELGGYLLGLWGLPYPIIEAAANHHAPERVPPGKGLDVFGAVYVANALAHELCPAARVEPEPYVAIDPNYLQALGIDDRLPGWREEAAAAIAQLGSSEMRRAA